MRPQKVLDKDILIALVKVFRTKGYEGASLSDLSEQTGLKKASLYHRFPKGKQEMANAVLEFTGNWVNDTVFKCLTDKEKSPVERLKNGLDEVNNFYDKGNEACLFKTMSSDTGLELFDHQVKNGILEWIKNFKDLGIAFGFTDKEADEKALKTVIEIQGSLILTKGLNNLNVFKNTLKEIENRYTIT